MFGSPIAGSQLFSHKWRMSVKLIKQTLFLMIIGGIVAFFVQWQLFYGHGFHFKELIEIAWGTIHYGFDKFSNSLSNVFSRQPIPFGTQHVFHSFFGGNIRYEHIFYLWSLRKQDFLSFIMQKWPSILSYASLLPTVLVFFFAYRDKKTRRENIVKGTPLLKGRKLFFFKKRMSLSFARQSLKERGLKGRVEDIINIWGGVISLPLLFLLGNTLLNHFHHMLDYLTQTFFHLNPYFLVATFLIAVYLECRPKSYKQSRALKLGRYKKSIDMPAKCFTQHGMMIGQSGSGKTTALIQMLDQIKERGDRAVIVDKGCVLLPRYFDSKKDYLLNPMDARSQNWHPWVELSEKSQCHLIASSLIPEGSDRSGNAKFFENASREVIKSMIRLMQLEGCYSVSELIRRLILTPVPQLYDMLKQTPAATYFERDDGGAAHSIKATVANYIAPFGYLSDVGKDESAFSVRQWVQDTNTDRWLFLASASKDYSSLKTLMSLQLELIIKEIMCLEKETDRQTWIIIDELPSLNYIGSLLPAVRETRKYGASILLGAQSQSDLALVYGERGVASLLQNLNTKMFFSCADTSTAKWVSDQFGLLRVKNTSSSSTISANDSRDSSSYHQQFSERKVIMPDDVMQLPIAQCYLASKFNLGRKTYRAKMMVQFPKPKEHDLAPDFVKTERLSAEDVLEVMISSSNEAKEKIAPPETQTKEIAPPKQTLPEESLMQETFSDEGEIDHGKVGLTVKSDVNGQEGKHVIAHQERLF